MSWMMVDMCSHVYPVGPLAPFISGFLPKSQWAPFRESHRTWPLTSPARYWLRLAKRLTALNAKPTMASRHRPPRWR
jgi:hypothetical protein